MGRGYKCRGCEVVKFQPWLGRCDNCGRYYDPVHTNIDDPQAEAAPLVEGEVMALCDVKVTSIARISTCIPGVDRVLGGGIVPGSVTMIAGSPGGGKSTLLLQIAQQLAKQRIQVLYVAGEEMVEQIKARADRIGVFRSALQIVRLTDLDDILNTVDEIRPAVFIVDSAQTIEVEDYTTGSSMAIKIAGDELNKLCKSDFRPALFIVAQVTKAEGFSGPNALMHAIDTSIFLKGSNKNKSRALECENKNRWGSTPQTAYFKMTASGLQEIPNPDPDDNFEEDSDDDKSASIKAIAKLTETEDAETVYVKPKNKVKEKPIKISSKKLALIDKKTTKLEAIVDGSDLQIVKAKPNPQANPVTNKKANSNVKSGTKKSPNIAKNPSRTTNPSGPTNVESEIASLAKMLNNPAAFSLPDGVSITSVLSENCDVTDCKGQIGRACTAASGVKEAGFHTSRIEKAKLSLKLGSSKNMTHEPETLKLEPIREPDFFQEKPLGAPPKQKPKQVRKPQKSSHN